MYVEPMLLQKADQPFNDNKYIAEWKQDGWRMLVSKWNGTIKLYSRHENEFTSIFKEFQDLDIPDNTIIDCELIAVDPNGKCDFEALQEQYRSKKRKNPLQLVAFDIIFYKGQDLRYKLSLLQRKQLLEECIVENEKIVVSRFIDGNYAIEYFELIKKQDLEGIVMKEKNSFYESRRSSKWLKVLNLKKEDLFLSGIRKEKFGAYLSFLDGSYAGMIEFMSPQDRKKIYDLIKSENTLEDDNKINFEKKPIIEVAYRNKFKSGLLRIPKLTSWY